jgi:predicted N-acetyltransferase YhbS
MTIISAAKSQELTAIQAFYQLCGYGGGAKGEDVIFLARLDAEIVGAVRLCPEHEVRVLRGMQVLAKFQHQGIGTQLLQTSTQHLGNQVCYCIPWAYLGGFYQQGGFEPVLPRHVPDFLRLRFEGYLERGMQVSLMCREPAT